MAQIALASSADDTDDPEITFLRTALNAAGHEVDVAVWDDPDVDWHAYAMTVIRTTWDYAARHDEFVEWVRRVPRIRNRAEVIAWNTHKTYLRDLARHGCPIIPTAWDVTDESTFGSYADAWGLPMDGTEWVVKPAVSAGARDTARWSQATDALTHSRSLVESGRTAMLQPYVASVDSVGETAVLFVGGEHSHTVTKGALLTSGEGVRNDHNPREVLTPTTASDLQLNVARQALRAARECLGGGLDLLYARVDLVDGSDGTPQVIELELTEPALFLPFAEGAAERFATAITSAVKSLGRL